MKKQQSIFILFLLSCLIGSAHSQETMPADRLTPGLKGYGVTVFTGTKLEKFDVEILGVLKKVRTKGDLIIAKLSGGPLEKTGVIAGMSGSPVYISNRLIGAVAFSWSFSKEPIAGITPIKDMLGILNYSIPTNNFRNPDFFKTPSENNGKQKIDSSDPGRSMERIATPLVFSGLDDRLFDSVRDVWSREGFIPVLGGADSEGSGITNQDELFLPGSAVAIKLVTGDLNVSGVGTVTYKDKDRILIFGHPMFFRGSCRYPVGTAEILSVFPGYQSSFKIATAGPTVGVTEQDREYAVSCRIGPKPDMVPVNIVQYYAGQKKEYHYEIIDDYIYFQNYLSTVIANTIMHDKAPLEKNSYTLEITLTLSDGRVVQWRNMYSELTTSFNMMSTIMDLSKPVVQILVNQYKLVSIRKVDVEIDQSDKISVAILKNMRLNNIGDIHPGDPLSLTLTLANYQGAEWKTNISIDLPSNLSEGPLLLFVTSSHDDQTAEEMLSPSALIPQNYEQLLQNIEDQPMNNDLVVWGLTREPGLVINGEKYNNLPLSRYAVMANSREDSTDPMAVRFKKKIPTGHYIFDMKKLVIPIKNPKFWRE